MPGMTVLPVASITTAPGRNRDGNRRGPTATMRLPRIRIEVRGIMTPCSLSNRSPPVMAIALAAGGASRRPSAAPLASRYRISITRRAGSASSAPRRTVMNHPTWSANSSFRSSSHTPPASPVESRIMTSRTRCRPSLVRTTVSPITASRA
jgi:hypothetical protein